MKVDFKDLGAVKEAKIDLSKKLIVFCGPNNTGKTYVSYAIYGIIEGLGNFFLKENNFFSQENLSDLIEQKEIILDLDVKALYGFGVIERRFKKNLDSIYGISKSEVDKLLGNASLKIDLSLEAFSDVIYESHFDITRDFGFIELRFTKVEKTKELRVTLIHFEAEALESYFHDVIGTKIFNIFAKYPAFSSHIFSVERNSIYTFSKELSVKRNMLIDEMQRVSDSKYMNPFEWMKRRATRYPLAIRDGLEIAEDIVNYQKTKSAFFEFADQIELEILDGKVTANKDGEVVFASNKAKSKKLPIHLSASLVKTLSSIIFYLRHLAKPNDLIIIDEPELNLHPNNQIIITRIFAKLINKGFRVLISTHSDYVIREINNLILSSSIDDEKLIKELGYSRDMVLSPGDVGAYLFRYASQRATKTVAKALEVSFDGFDVSSIDDTIDELNERSMKLYQGIEDQKGGDDET